MSNDYMNLPPQIHSMIIIITGSRSEAIENIEEDAPPCTKVLIEDVPSHKRDNSLLKCYLNSLNGNDCEVQQYGKQFMATFSQQIGRDYNYVL